MNLKKLAQLIQEDPENYLEYMTDIELDTDDRNLFSFIECFRDIPKEYAIHLASIFDFIADKLPVKKKFVINTIGELVASYKNCDKGLYGSIFEVIENNTTYSVVCVGPDFVICHDLSCSLWPIYFSFNQEIRYVF